MRWLTLLVLTIGCDAGMDDLDGGGLDAGSDDGGISESDAGPDGGMSDPDAGMTMCGPGQHACGDGCIDLLPNNPSNGCALGCGEACTVADAICNADGTCGTMGCEPMSCEALSAECGLVDNGCGGRRSCGTCDTTGGERCVDNQCVTICMMDPREANESRAAATNLGTLVEDDPPVAVTNGTIHAGDDSDWYRVDITNECCDGDPFIDVTLSALPAGEDYDLEVVHVCPDGTQMSACNRTTATIEGIAACRAEAVGADSLTYHTDCDDGGTVFVHVYSAGWNGSCAPYRLEIRAY